jgi:hypothetical protein
VSASGPAFGILYCPTKGADFLLERSQALRPYLDHLHYLKEEMNSPVRSSSFLVRALYVVAALYWVGSYLQSIFSDVQRLAADDGAVFLSWLLVLLSNIIWLPFMFFLLFRAMNVAFARNYLVRGDTTRIASVMRIAGISYMALSVTLLAAFVIGHFTASASGWNLGSSLELISHFAAEGRPFNVVGLLLFEFSRLVDNEVFILGESNKGA